ncbi:hypothetical protein GCM10010104_33900 [Streptomyces indiaensis]|uniref:Uncharacterized protein n=1 Tax=Streptomyces indiaensis TaxID=284033 RepID=A0ABN3DM57_9ACTN
MAEHPDPTGTDDSASEQENFQAQSVEQPPFDPCESHGDGPFVVREDEHGRLSLQRTYFTNF